MPPDPPLRDDILRDEGFREGVLFVVKHIRLAAKHVIACYQIHYGKKLNDLADELERLVSQ